MSTWKRGEIKEERPFDVDGVPDIADITYPRDHRVVRPREVVLHLRDRVLWLIHVKGPRILRNGTEGKSNWSISYLAHQGRKRDADALPEWLAELVGDEGLPWGDTPDV